MSARSGMGPYTGAARRRFHLETVLLRPSGHRSGRRQTRHAHILQIERSWFLWLLRFRRGDNRFGFLQSVREVIEHANEPLRISFPSFRKLVTNSIGQLVGRIGRNGVKRCFVYARPSSSCVIILVVCKAVYHESTLFQDFQYSKSRIYRTRI